MNRLQRRGVRAVLFIYCQFELLENRACVLSVDTDMRQQQGMPLG